MKGCRFVRRLLALHPADRSHIEGCLVEAHLARCPDCIYLARVYTEQDRLIRAASYADGVSTGQASQTGWYSPN